MQGSANLNIMIKAARKAGKQRDLFLYVISGQKLRNPAAAMALIERLKT